VRDEFARAVALLQAAARITAIGHVRPDGDTVGSLLALTLGLEEPGKQVIPILADGVPERFRFLAGAERVERDLPGDKGLLVTIDCSDLERTGFSLQSLGRPPDLNIDHHPTNKQYAACNLVDVRASATAEILYRLAPDILSITESVAASLLVGIITDTIGFRTASVTPDTLRVAAELVEQGAALPALYQQSLVQKSFSAARYWGMGLSKLERDGDIVWATLTLDDKQRSGYEGLDDADLVNLLTTIEEARIVLLFVEQPEGRVKVSWRSRGEQDVSQLAEWFGGGGHEPAAGAMIEGGLEEVKARVLAATREHLPSSS
jgi:phosphoesterase RecJ-like protein